MSLRALVLPEDPSYNGYVLKPLVERMLAEVGRPNARVLVLANPKLNGYDDAVRAIRVELEARYGFYDLWLFLPDGDRATGLETLERSVAEKGIRLLFCSAQPEIEAWLLAGHRHRLHMAWPEVCSHARLKEEVFGPFLQAWGDPLAAGGGREKLMRETLRNYRGLLEVCPELAVLETRLRNLLEKTVSV